MRTKNRFKKEQEESERDWAVVAAHMVERSFRTPEVCGSNLVIDKFYVYVLSIVLKGGREWPKDQNSILAGKNKKIKGSDRIQCELTLE